MAIYRQLHVTFWQDPFITELTPEEKYFYLYLMTNGKTRQCGVYEIGKKYMAFETGYNNDTIEKLLTRFIEYRKIQYNEETKEILILNWLKYNFSKSPKILSCILREIETIKFEPFKAYLQEYLYSIDTVSLQYRKTRGKNKNKNKKNNNNKNNNKNNNNDNILSSDDDDVESKQGNEYQEIVAEYNTICESLPKVIQTTDKRKKQIRSILKESKREIMTTVFRKAQESDFLSGRNGKWTTCNFDWLMTHGNFLKVLEGSYDNKASPTKNIPKAFASLHEYMTEDEGTL